MELTVPQSCLLTGAGSTRWVIIRPPSQAQKPPVTGLSSRG